MFWPVLSTTLQMHHRGRLWFHHPPLIFSPGLLAETAAGSSSFLCSSESCENWTRAAAYELFLYNRENPETTCYTHRIARKMGTLCRRLADLQFGRTGNVSIIVIIYSHVVTYTVQRCFFLSWNRANAVWGTIIKSKNMPLIFLAWGFRKCSWSSKTKFS